MRLRNRIGLWIVVILLVAASALALAVSYEADCEPAPPLAAGVETMKAVTYRCYGSADVLALEDVEKPVPAAGEILVKVRTAAVNPLDWHFMRGKPYLMRLMSGLGKPQDPRMGVDFSGVVESVGPDVTRFSAGDEVFGGIRGAFAEYVLVREDQPVVHKPENVTFEQAGTVGIAGVTALQALRDKGDLKPGQKVLINGASGGVGTFAVQIAKSLGAEVHGVCSARNVEMVKSIGAARVYDYRQENYTDSEEQYDVIVDMISNHSLGANRGVLGPNGTLVIVGGSSGDWLGPMLRPIAAMVYSPFVGQNLGMMMARGSKEDLSMLAALLQSGEVTPVIDREYGLSDVPAAIRYSEEGHARGKIVIRVN
jgi:NADPH:quinone reductase-like Zn-dependent oxidoreductase